MFKIEELSGSLIRSGKFSEAIPKFWSEIQLALQHGIITQAELLECGEYFSRILLNPSDVDEVNALAGHMIKLAFRIPDYVPSVPTEEFKDNVKASRGEA